MSQGRPDDREIGHLGKNVTGDKVEKMPEK